MSVVLDSTHTRTTEHQAQSSSASVRVRVYHPNQPNGTGIVWIHGGAFSMNDIDVPESDWVARCLANAGITVVAPDYRLARDGIHFPSLTDDCAAAWIWATQGTSVLGQPPMRWHIGGGSAGGNLAASVSMQIRDRAIIARSPRSTVLVYPVLHSPLPAPSEELRAKLHDLPPDERYSREDMERIDLNYVGPPLLLHHPYAFPGHGDLAGMPPTFIVNSEHDPLRSSGERFGTQLAAAGVDHAMIREIDAHHGHLNFPELPTATRTVRRVIDWLSRPDFTGTQHESM